MQEVRCILQTYCLSRGVLKYAYEADIVFLMLIKLFNYISR